MTGLTPRLAGSLIESAAARLAANEDELSRLDSVAGDGDHGVNMVSAFTEAEKRIAAEPDAATADVFDLTAGAFLETVGGAAGALFGAFFTGVGRALDGVDAPSPPQFVAALEKGRDRLVRIGNTEPGQKTMVDALDPALQAAHSAVEAGQSLPTTLAAAAAAAAAGAAATAGMEPKAGRAKYAAAQSLGSPDAGATTVAHMFAAWADVLTSEVVQ